MSVEIIKSNLQENGLAFLNFLDNWMAELPTISFEEVLKGGSPDKVALFSVDLVNGFCYEGKLASPRVAAVVEPARQIFEKAYAHGVSHFMLVEDCHTPEAGEFGEFPPHCLAGTSEAETVASLANLPYVGSFTILPKNSLSAALEPGLEVWLQARPQLDTYLLVGDCTDLCVYQLAIYLKLRANRQGQRQRVIVPANAVATYDLKLDGVGNHPGDFFQVTFLYHLALNGIEVVRTLE
ncbi:MAG: isochorismatase family cysteine hydrolase [Chloroflexota bacterium]|nr:cysteine hydrolase [Chloroflexota bacterium]